MNRRCCEGCQAGQKQLRVHFKLEAGHCRHHTLSSGTPSKNANLPHANYCLQASRCRVTR